MNGKIRNIICFAVMILSVVSMIFGIMSGECETVLTKATNVCLECIGIG